jgi:hypothetical protein
MLFGPFGLAFAFAAGIDRRCPHCQERIHPDATRCPKCQADLRSQGLATVRKSQAEDDPRPAALINAFPSGPARPQAQSAILPTKRCPDCAEDVRPEARKCRFCGFIFPEPPIELGPEPIQLRVEVAAPVPKPDDGARRQWQEQPKKNFNYLALVIYVLSVLGILGVGYVELRPDKAPRQPEGEMSAAQAPPKIAAEAKAENTVVIDTWSCSTFEAIVFQSGSPEPSAPNCVDLNRGTRVIGPIEVRVSPRGTTRFARIEIPGRGGAWTYMAHLAN